MKKIISILAVVLLCACAASELNAQTVDGTQTIDATEQIMGVSSLEGVLTCYKGNLMMNGRVLTPAEMSALFPANVFSSATGGQRMRRAGKGMMIGGGIATGVGFLAYLGGLAAVNNSSADGGYAGFMLAYCGIVDFAIGSGVLAGGIAIYCVGNGRIRRAVNAYNSMHTREYTLNIGATPHGLGLSVAF